MYIPAHWGEIEILKLFNALHLWCFSRSSPYWTEYLTTSSVFGGDMHFSLFLTVFFLDNCTHHAYCKCVYIYNYYEFNIFWFNLQLYLGLWLVRTKLLWWWCWFFGGWSMFSAAVCQFILNTSAAGSSAVGFSWRVDGSKSAQCLSWDAPAVSSANETAGLLTERTSCR